MTNSPESAHQSQPEKEKEVLGDNARKFTIESLDRAFLEKNNASGILLITDWIEVGADNEKKVAYKKFENGDTQILLISKITDNGHRISEKEKISEEEYSELIKGSVLHLEKMRYEFPYTQSGVMFDIKYDEFTNSSLRVLEVDAPTDEGRESFNPSDFPATLSEVTGNRQYYGYRVADIVQSSQ